MLIVILEPTLLGKYVCNILCKSLGSLQPLYDFCVIFK